LDAGAADGGKRPIMVYLHGGEFSTGSGSSLYDGAVVSCGDVVVVGQSPAQHLRSLICLALRRADYASSGNVGILDLVTASSGYAITLTEFGIHNVMVFGNPVAARKSQRWAMPAARISSSCDDECSTTAQGLARRDVACTRLLRSLKICQTGARIDQAPPVGGGIAAADPTLPAACVLRPVLTSIRSSSPVHPDAPLQSAHIPTIIGNTRDETIASENEPGCAH
jgi:para-nitrobenzyl esterase